MKPVGIILTYMRWMSKWFLFNLVLFLWQIVFIIAGTVYGKIKWREYFDRRKDLSFIVMVSGNIIQWISVFRLWIYGHHSNWHCYFLAGTIILLIGFLEYRGVRWKKVWHAAQVCHVRLCLEKVKIRWIEEGYGIDYEESIKYKYISFGYPVAKLDYWWPGMIDGKQFEYRDPTFDPSPEFIAAMIEYAYAQEGKDYDVPQLASYAVNLPIWIVRPKYWGLEICKWFNRPGGHECCSSGVAACLRWAEFTTEFQYGRILRKIVIETGFLSKIFFEWFDTAMVPPCLFKIDKNWRGNEERKAEADHRPQ